MGSKTIRNIQKIFRATSGVLFGRKTVGTGRGEELLPVDVRTLLSVYSTTEVDAIIGGIDGLTSADIDTLAEINAILTDADLASISYVDSGLSGKQATLVSGTNIKTVNSTSLLGSGDIAISSGIDVQNFTSSGTWTKPTGKTHARIILVGAGGGGGSGRRGSAGTLRCGGGGGGGGAIIVMDVPLSLLADTVSVTIGGGGNGGAARTADDTSGANGAQGSVTLFGSLFKATAGDGGGGGSATAGGGGTHFGNYFLGLQHSPTGGASAGGAGANAVTNTPTSANYPITLGGGGGGAVNTSNAVVSGASGASFGPTYVFQSVVSGGSAGAAGASGSVGNSLTAAYATLGTGGGGGGASAGAVAAGAGGSGGSYGAGGGGGGASLNGFNSGAGGPGAGGFCRVISY